MLTLSLCMIVKNEEEVLERCLKSVKKIADEIIIVDTGSSDRTKEIANKYTDKVFDFEWINDFSAARNYAFSKARKDYIMWLDADDEVLEDDGKKMLELKETLSLDCNVVTMKYNVGFDANGKVNFQSTRGRWFRRSDNPRWLDCVHEYVPLGGHIVSADDIAITHKHPASKGVSHRNLEIYQSMVNAGKEFSPRSQYYYARELKDHGKHQESVEWFEKFLAGNCGWVEDNICACYNLCICYQALKKPQEALAWLYKSFEYDAPRSEICCMIGYHYKNLGEYLRAGTWFDIALKLPPTHSMGFVLTDYHEYIPAIEACVCFDKLGDKKKAREYNELAGTFKPMDSQYLYNKRYFENISK